MKKPNNIRPEIKDAFDKAVRKRFGIWQKKHPDLKIRSATMNPIQLMLYAMSLTDKRMYPKPKLLNKRLP